MKDQGTARAIAAWVAERDASELSPAAMTQGKLLTLDTIGCALAALAEDEPRHVLDAVAAMGGREDASVIGGGFRTTAAGAVLANGVLLRFLDLNDFLLGTTLGGMSLSGHPSDNIAVSLAVAEAQGASGRDAILATAIAYELYGRLKGLLDSESVWDGTSISGIAGAAVTGKLMGLEEDRMAHAIALGAARASTPAIMRSGDISAGKFLANAMIARTAVEAAELAAHGLTGPLQIFDHPRGLSQVYTKTELFKDVLAPFEDATMLLRAEMKAYPCLATGQTTVAAALEMHKRLGGDVSGIEEITLTMMDTPGIARQQVDPGRLDPQSRESADHSFTFLAAVPLVDGRFTSRQFDGERWNDPAIRALMGRVGFARDAAWNDRVSGSYPCTMTVRLTDGTEHEVEVAAPPGHSATGGVDADAVTDKFDAVTEGILDDATREEVKATVLELDSLADIRGLMARLSAVTLP
jgi:2-methylcitrate dehydratase